MLRRALLRLLAAIPITLLVSAAVFFLLEMAPGDPSVILVDPLGTNEVNATQRKILGLDEPMPARFAKWMAASLTLDFGRSFTDGRPVREKVAEALPATLALSGASLLVGFAGGIALALLCVWRPRGALDGGISFAALFLGSMPIFWLAMVSIAFAAVEWGMFPPGGVLSPNSKNTTGLHLGERLHHLALPCAILASYIAAHASRYTRAALVETLDAEFIRAVRARGAGRARTLLAHALPNSLHSTIALFGLSLPYLAAGSVVIEWLFDWPGMGRLLMNALLRRDYPVACAGVLAVSFLCVLGNLVAEEISRALDPRVART
jgi:peptide/nickel transport system permease protein